MTNHVQFNKISKKIKGRQFWCKNLYDNHFYQKNGNDLGKNEVYLKKEMDDVINEFRILFEEQQDEIIKQRRRADMLELEEYRYELEAKRLRKIIEVKKNEKGT